MGAGSRALARVLRPSCDSDSKPAARRFRVVTAILLCPRGAHGRPKAKQLKHRTHSLSRPRPVLTLEFVLDLCFTEWVSRQRSGGCPWCGRLQCSLGSYKLHRTGHQTLPRGCTAVRMKVNDTLTCGLAQSRRNMAHILAQPLLHLGFRAF